MIAALFAQRTERRMFLAFPLLLAAASAAAATPADQAEIERVIRIVAAAIDYEWLSQQRVFTWPDGHYVSISLDAPPSRPTRHSWATFMPQYGIGITYRTRVFRPVIRVLGNRATADVRWTSYLQYDHEYAGVRYVSQNRITLERRRGQWRVLDWTRRYRKLGSDAEWHRRHRQ